MCFEFDTGRDSFNRCRRDNKEVVHHPAENVVKNVVILS